MEKIYLATQNKHKVVEINSIMKSLDIELEDLSSFGDLPDAIEDGLTFLENAQKKARHYFGLIKKPVLADDSGLVVPALDGKPGIYSARYAGIPVDYQRNNDKLLQEMRTFSGKQRRAYFICQVVYLDDQKELLAEGKVEGIISGSPRGKNGFGYDPIFEIPQLGKTFAELDSMVKNSMSHRYLAFIKMAKLLSNYW